MKIRKQQPHNKRFERKAGKSLRLSVYARFNIRFSIEL